MYYKAIEFFEKAISLDMGNPMHLLWVAYANYLNLEFSSCQKKNDCQEKEALTLIIRKLEKARNSINEKTDDEIKAYILYFLGYSYSKIHNSFEAKEILEECVNIKSTIKNPSRKLLDNIWNYQIKPNWIEWWLASPIHCWMKRFVFSIISLSVFVLFLFPIIFPNNKDNFSSYYFFIVFLLIIIISPRIESFKANEFEIEIQSPPPNEFFLSTPIIEFRIKELERMLTNKE